jgi:adenine/guanine phosphoribosyltransferase-like PRPP-binding protein
MWHTPETCRYAFSPNSSGLYNPDKFKPLLDKIGDKLQDIYRKTAFDAIAGCGFSGLPLLGALSYKLGIPYIAVRKEDEKAHSTDTQGLIFSARFVIVDDLFETGQTIKRIINGVSKAHNSVLEWGAPDGKGSVDRKAPVSSCVGIVLYADDLHMGVQEVSGIPLYIVR